MVDVGVTAFSESAVRNTSAKAGAGTGMVQVLAFWSHWIVVTFSVPFSRPSDFKALPSVCGREKDCHERRSRERTIAKEVEVQSIWDELTCPAHVKLPLDATDGAKRYLQGPENGKDFISDGPCSMRTYLTCTCEGTALLWPVEPPPMEITAL